MNGMLSPDIVVMFRPKRTFEALSRWPPPRGRWLAWRRPLFVAAIFGICASLLTRSYLSLLLAGSAAISWTFLPLVQIAGLAAVQRARPDGRLVDQYFTGHGPWLLWLIAFTAYSAWPAAVFSQSTFRFWIVMAVLVLIWSCWIDYRFFGSARRLAVHRAISWTLFGAIFAGAWLWNEIAWRLGL